MGIQSWTNPPRLTLRLFWALAVWLTVGLGAGGAQTTQALTVPLLLPSALAYDGVGNLYVAEARGHQVLVVSPTGGLSLLAGTGVQGFAGDGGPAGAAELDSPEGLAFSPGGICISPIRMLGGFGGWTRRRE